MGNAKHYIIFELNGALHTAREFFAAVKLFPFLGARSQHVDRKLDYIPLRDLSEFQFSNFISTFSSCGVYYSNHVTHAEQNQNRKFK